MPEQEAVTELHCPVARFRHQENGMEAENRVE